MAKLTVLGGHGFIGSHFVDVGSKENHFVINEKYDTTIDGKYGVINFISTVSNYNVLTNPYVDINVNLHLLIEMLEGWRCTGGKGVWNQISSWFVYGDSDFPATEKSRCNPKGFYSITKRAAEQLIISYCETYNLSYRILRLANVIGKDPKASREKNAVVWMLREIKQNKDVNVYEDGNIIRDFIHVSDCVDAIDLILDKGEENAIYNIGNGYPITVGEILRYGKNKYNSKSNLISVPIPRFHEIVQTKNFFMNIDKLKGLGYNPRSQEEIIKQIVDEV